MDFFSHFLIGMLISYFTLRSLSPEMVAFAGIMAALPDFDVFLMPLQKIHKSFYFSHRGGSHSYVTSAIISLIASGIIYIVFNDSFILSWLIGFLFYSLHITLDFLTSFKTPIFYPIIKKEYNFSVERAVNPFIMFFSLSITILYVIFFNNSVSFFYYYTLSIFSLGFYLTYLTYRTLTKIWVQARLPDHNYFLPGTYPFVYFIYENYSNDGSLLFKFSKKYQFFSKKIIIIESKIDKGSMEMEYFDRAKNEIGENIFFAKWEYILPIIIKDENSIIIVLILAESLSKNFSFYFQVTFDKKTYQVVEKSDGFNFKKKFGLNFKNIEIKNRS